MSMAEHLSDELLVRSIDDELPGLEVARVESHLALCDQCRHKHQQLRAASARLEAAVAAFVPDYSGIEREGLISALETRERNIPVPAAQTVLRRFGWGMGLAATLAIGILLGPQWTRHASLRPAAQEQQAGAAFEVDGETFVALPYSNPDLPVTAPHIVQMQVPVSSLTDAGIVLEPVSSEISAPDRSVLADVLLGIDGQPIGVHVLSAE